MAGLEPGEVSPPVKTQFGWHVIYLADKQVTPFEDAKAGLLEPVADQEFRGWLEERADELGVEVNPRFGRFSAATFSVQPARSTDPSDAVVPEATPPRRRRDHRSPGPETPRSDGPVPCPRRAADSWTS